LDKQYLSIMTISILVKAK